MTLDATDAPDYRPSTFIVRISIEKGGRARGVVERVRTGEKLRFQGFEAIGPLIAAMVGSVSGEAQQAPSGGQP